MGGLEGRCGYSAVSYATYGLYCMYVFYCTHIHAACQLSYLHNYLFRYRHCMLLNPAAVTQEY